MKCAWSHPLSSKNTCCLNNQNTIEPSIISALHKLIDGTTQLVEICLQLDDSHNYALFNQHYTRMDGSPRNNRVATAITRFDALDETSKYARYITDICSSSAIETFENV